jgi:preprotein translocase subunit Sss1
MSFAEYAMTLIAATICILLIGAVGKMLILTYTGCAG